MKGVAYAEKSYVKDIVQLAKHVHLVLYLKHYRYPPSPANQKGVPQIKSQHFLHEQVRPIVTQRFDVGLYARRCDIFKRCWGTWVHCHWGNSRVVQG